MPLYFLAMPATLYEVTGQCAYHSRKRGGTAFTVLASWRIAEELLEERLDYEGWRAFLAAADGPSGYLSRSFRLAHTKEAASLAVGAAGLPNQRSSPLDHIYSQPLPGAAKQQETAPESHVNHGKPRSFGRTVKRSR